MKYLLLTLSLLGHASFALAGDSLANCAAIPKGIRSIPAKVVRDRDGDTVVVSTSYGQFAVRFLGIDTLETHYMQQSQGHWGEEAAKYLASLLPPGTDVVLATPADQTCDTYGRILAHIFKGEVHINRAMVEAALAVNYCIAPNLEYCEEFGDIVNANVAAKRGIFSDPNLELPYDFRRRISGRPDDRLVGDIKTHEVFSKANRAQVQLGDRVFFEKETDVQAPFHRVD